MKLSINLMQGDLQMLRVTFDPSYIDDLQDYYVRNECIHEQQYLSPEKLLHLAAFCTSKVAAQVHSDDVADSELRHQAASDAVRQLTVLCCESLKAPMGVEPARIVYGLGDVERQRQETNAPPVGASEDRCQSWRSAGSYLRRLL